MVAWPSSHVQPLSATSHPVKLQQAPCEAQHKSPGASAGAPGRPATPAGRHLQPITSLRAWGLTGPALSPVMYNQELGHWPQLAMLVDQHVTSIKDFIIIMDGAMYGT